MHSSTLPLTSALEGSGCSTPRSGRFTPGKTRYPQYRRLSGPRTSLDGYGKSRPPTGIRSPDGPACTQSLYQLRYPAHHYVVQFLNYCRSVEWCAILKNFTCCTLKTLIFLSPSFLQRMHIAVVTTKLIHILLQIKWALEAGYYVMV